MGLPDIVAFLHDLRLITSLQSDMSQLGSELILFMNRLTLLFQESVFPGHKFIASTESTKTTSAKKSFK